MLKLLLTYHLSTKPLGVAYIKCTASHYTKTTETYMLLV